MENRSRQPLRLRRREFELLWALMGHAGRALSRQELPARVWGTEQVRYLRSLAELLALLQEILQEEAFG